MSITHSMITIIPFCLYTLTSEDTAIPVKRTVSRNNLSRCPQLATVYVRALKQARELCDCKDPLGNPVRSWLGVSKGRKS